MLTSFPYIVIGIVAAAWLPSIAWALLQFTGWLVELYAQHVTPGRQTRRARVEASR